VYHPNIDTEGEIFIDIFKSEYWSPAIRISKALIVIVSVLCTPLLDLPVRRGIARQYSHERALFETKARDWTRRYAMAKEGDCEEGLRARRAGLLAALARFVQARARVHAASSSLAC
jgi:hypothetical protein